MNVVDLSDHPILETTGHSSKGNQPKWKMGQTWYKADYRGYEALAEVVVSKLLKNSNVKNFVSYSPVKIQVKNKLLMGCESGNFQKKMKYLFLLKGCTGLFMVLV